MPNDLFSHRKQLGAEGEKRAAQHITKLGYKIVEKNFRCKWGEIDLIAEHNEYLVFIEVKTRKGAGQINPLISLTRQKLKKLAYLGKFYLVTRKIVNKQPRFDVISLVEESPHRFVVEHIVNAFTV